MPARGARIHDFDGGAIDREGRRRPGMSAKDDRRERKKAPDRSGALFIRNCGSALDQKSMPPMPPPMPPPGMPPASFFGSSATIASVVMSRAATEAAS